jgi:chromosome segregation ATPase
MTENMSSAMDDVNNTIMAAMLPQLTRLGERVASLEAMANNSERDLAAIRRSLHDLNNAVVPLISDRQRFAEAHVENVAKINELSGKLTKILELRNQGIGAWRALVWIAGITVSVAALIGWAMTHHFSITVN